MSLEVLHRLDNAPDTAEPDEIIVLLCSAEVLVSTELELPIVPLFLNAVRDRQLTKKCGKRSSADMKWSIIKDEGALYVH